MNIVLLYVCYIPSICLRCSKKKKKKNPLTSSGSKNCAFLVIRIKKKQEGGEVGRHFSQTGRYYNLNVLLFNSVTEWITEWIPIKLLNELLTELLLN